MPNHYRIVRTKLSGESLDDWSPADKIVRNIGLLVVAVIALPSIQAQNGLGPLIIFSGLILLLLLLLRPNTGYARVYEGAILQSRHAANMKAAQRKLARPSNEHNNSFEPSLTQRVIEADDELGVRHRIPVLSHLDPEVPYDHVYVRVRGGKFVDNHNEELVEAINELADIINMTLGLTELTAGITPLFIRTPLDTYEDYQYLKERGNPLVTDPDNFEIVDEEEALRIGRLRETSDEFEPMVRAYGMVDDWSLFVITIRRDRTTSSLFQGQEVSEDEVYNLPVLLLARGLVDRLKASTRLGYYDVEIVKEHDLCIMVRQAWDIVGIHDFYKQIAPYRLAYDAGLLSEEKFADILWTEIGCLPETFESVRPEYALVDGNYTSMIRITELPEYVYPSVENDMLRLGLYDVWLRCASVGVGSSASVERTRLYGQKASNANFVSAFLSWLTIVPDSVTTKQEELEERTRQLRNVPLVQRYERYAALVGASPGRLSQARSDYESSVKSQRYKPEVVTLTSVHRDTWLASCLGIHT